MDNLQGKILQYCFWTSISIISVYRLLSYVEVPLEFDRQINGKEHGLNMKYLSGMRDGGYKLDRELIAINERSWKD